MIIAVSGGKGGVGKSTLSLNLGYELDAVIVDADLATADLPAGAGRGPNLHDVLAGRAEPMAAVETVGPIRLLPCGRTLEGARASKLVELTRVVERLERQCGRVVIDCPAGLAQDVGVELYSADVAVLVTMPNRVALHDAYRTRRLALDVETPIGSVVLNQCRSTDAEDLVGQVEAKMGAPVTVIERRADIAAAQAAGRPLRTESPTSPMLEGFDSITWAIERCERHLSGGIGVL
ncbi:P-loop NTPase [Halobacteria archaeon AArc-curdl1]|uniref:P-loop NTPase n=1 Tax=Natronosalvus hydrolyticus TaxID=2979988 RepID=A0AAP2Z6K3_9EURY|nr:P-loop NTPase [Halobacteria archaeon AArc-curdl1]